jgi:hypothetical protein
MERTNRENTPVTLEMILAETQGTVIGCIIAEMIRLGSVPSSELSHKTLLESAIYGLMQIEPNTARGELLHLIFELNAIEGLRTT